MYAGFLGLVASEKCQSTLLRFFLQFVGEAVAGFIRILTGEFIGRVKWGFLRHKEG